MKTFLKVLIILLITGNFSCQQKENSIVTIDKIEREQESQVQIPNLSLNDGKLWIANKETTQGIQKMQGLLTNYSVADGWSEELIIALNSEFATIFEKCTMKGKAHDQLHNFLIPLNAKIENLSEGITVENMDNLKNYLKEYYNYFQ